MEQQKKKVRISQIINVFLIINAIFDAVDDLRSDESFVILMTPQGVKYNQKIAYNFTSKKTSLL